MARTTYILIDYENVQPNDLDLVPRDGWKVKVFLGRNQKKIPVETVNALQPLGDRAEYIPSDTGGRNALDFYIAYRIGVQAQQEPDSGFEVISGDNDLEPLLERLRKEGISAHLRRYITDIPSFASKRKAAITPLTPEESVQKAVEYLTVHSDKRAKRQKGLENNLKTHFRITSDEAKELVVELKKHRFIIVLADGHVEYQFPNLSAAA